MLLKVFIRTFKVWQLAMLYGCTLGNGEFTFIAGTISYLLEQCVYSVIDHSSLSDCTMQCLLDEYNNCSRFVFESGTQRCMLQSDYISSDVPTTTINTTQAMMFFEAHVGKHTHTRDDIEKSMKDEKLN